MSEGDTHKLPARAVRPADRRDTTLLALRRLRRDTQAQVIQKAGLTCTQQTYSNWEKGLWPVSVTGQEKLARYYGQTARRLCRKDGMARFAEPARPRGRRREAAA